MKLPQAFIDKYTTLLGADAPAFLQSFQEPAQKGFRINPLKSQTQLADVSLAQAKPAPYSRWGRLGSVDGHGVDHVTGLVYSQEPSAQLVATVLAPKPGEKVLDLSAAPGGKTTQLAAYMNQKGLLWANEIVFNRAKILSENVERFGIKNAVVSSATPKQLAQQLPGFFDKVLVDAPCSGEGMFRKDPSASQYWHSDYPHECSLLQRDILADAVLLVRPGGSLVYSTCTFAPEEDEQVIDWLTKQYPDFTIQTINKKELSQVADGRPDWAGDDANPDLVHTGRLWPQNGTGEGHFVAKLVKNSTAAAPGQAVKPDTSVVKLSKAEQNDWQQFVHETLVMSVADFPKERLHRFGDQLFLAPKGLPELAHLKVLRLGLALGRFKKGRFEPDHALALALSPDQVQQSYAVDEQQYRQYVHGDVLTVNEQGLHKGFVLILANGNGLGWAKYVNGQLKNFYPKGLRFGI